jgi:hypothetical protein
MSPEVQSELIAKLNTRAEVLRAESYSIQRERAHVRAELSRVMRGEW